MQGSVLAIAVKSAKRGPMIEIDEAVVVTGRGIVGGAKPSPKRAITLLDRDRWEAALRDAGANLPWHTRRANVLVEGLDLPALIGQRIRIGTVELQINGETRPCPRMDEAHPGLQKAMRPDCRGGIYGSILQEGSFRIGDPVIPLYPESGKETSLTG